MIDIFFAVAERLVFPRVVLFEPGGDVFPCLASDSLTVWRTDVYEAIFWIWFVGACGCFAYNSLHHDNSEAFDDAIEGAVWPIAIGGLALTFAIAGVIVLARKIAKAIR